MKHRIILHYSIVLAITAALCAALLPESAFSQTYSYRDENGILVLTNIAPSKPVGNLKVYGTPPAPAPLAKVPAGKNAKPRNSVQSKPRPGVRPTPIRESTVAAGNIRPVADTVTTVPAIGPIIDKYAREFQLDPQLIRSVIATESAYQHRAVSPKGALGLMQLMPSTAARLGVSDPFDPDQNIRGGVKHLRFLMNTFNNDLSLSLAAYNAGENLVARLGRVPNIRETQDYVRSITTRYGGSEMQIPAFEPVSPAKPSIFRFLDSKGILYITNIPPVQSPR